MTHLTFSTKTIRTLAVVPGMREIGYAAGLGNPGPHIRLRYWRLRALPRSAPPERIRMATDWISSVITDWRITQVLIVPPLPWHLRQRKNKTSLSALTKALEAAATDMQCFVVRMDRREISDHLGRPVVPPDAPVAPVRSSWALAALFHELDPALALQQLAGHAQKMQYEADVLWRG